MVRNDSERKINVWDMIWGICLRWRRILVCALIFSIIAGVYSYCEGMKMLASTPNSGETTIEELFAQMNTEEQKDVRAYLSYVETYEELIYYNENAPIMKLDASDFYVGEVGYYIENYYEVEYPVIAKSNNALAMVSAYQAAISTEEFSKKVKDIFGELENSYAIEMVDCKGLYGNTNIYERYAGQPIFTISVYGQDEETCSALMELVKKTVEEKRIEIEKQFGEHDLCLIQDVLGMGASSELLGMQKSKVELAVSCYHNIYTMSSRFSVSQQTYVNEYFKKNLVSKEDKKEILNFAEEKKTVPGIDKKLVLLGFLLGVFLAFALEAVLYIFDGKLRLEDDFEGIYKTILLGTVSSNENEKKKWFWFVDAFFVKLRHFNQRYFKYDEALDLIASNIRIAVAKTGIKRVMITGAICGNEENKVVQEISKRVKNDGIEIVFEKPILYDAEALEKLTLVKQIVLVEKAAGALYGEIQKEIEICSQQEVNLIGCIVVY